MSDIVAVAHTLAQTLEKLGVVYWIGGSMASAIHGVPRSTQDVDFVAELKVQANALDYDYLRHWAAEIGVDDLLLRAFDDAGIITPTSAK